jgi:hypothetical protein
MKVSASQVIKGQTCMKQVFFHYVLRIKPEVQSANLAFGKAVDSTIMDFLAADFYGSEMSMESSFLKHWETESSKPLEYSATQSEQRFVDMGSKMVNMFPEAWHDTGLMVFTMPDDTPALQVKLELQITPKSFLNGYLDLIAMDHDGQIIVPDVKTTGVAYDDIFVKQSDQLTAYQILVDGHAKTLGIEQVDQLGFLTLQKKVEPEIHKPKLVGRRSPERVQEYKQTCDWYVDDFQAGRFNRTSLGAFNSPCSLCDFKLLCTEGNTDGLVVSDDALATLGLTK